jgi:hypothetical protein
MKEIERKDHAEVSGGYKPGDDSIPSPFPSPDYPFPIPDTVPVPGPMPDPVYLDPSAFAPNL